MRRVLEHIVEWKEIHDEMVKDVRNAELNFQKELKSKQVSKINFKWCAVLYNLPNGRYLADTFYFYM